MDGSNGLTEEILEDANAVLERPLNFYGGYLMEAMHKKKDILKDAVVKKLLKVIVNLKEEMKLMDIDREAVNNVATLNFDLA